MDKNQIKVIQEARDFIKRIMDLTIEEAHDLLVNDGLEIEYKLNDLLKEKN